jgi:hypothetical protein
MCLWEFFWNFCDFRNIFRAFKQFLGFFWNCFRIKNNFEKKEKKEKIYPIYLGRARRPDQVRTGPADGPRGAHLSPREPIGRQLSMADTPPLPPASGVRTLDCCVPRPYIERALGPMP